MAEEGTKLSVTEVENMVHAHAMKWAKEHYTIPETAFRVFLSPHKYGVVLIPGPTAKIHIGLQAWPFVVSDWWETLKRTIDRVCVQHLYSTMAVESVAHILERERGMRRWWKEKFDFEPELIPTMLHDEDISVRQVERIEVIHKPTGMREVVEVEPGKARTTYAAKDIAKSRLARRVHELKVAEAAKLKDNEVPFPKTA
jgi:hypothetical protein